MAREFTPGKKGLLKGKIKIGAEFYQPLPDEVIALFEGRVQP